MIRKDPYSHHENDNPSKPHSHSHSLRFSRTSISFPLSCPNGYSRGRDRWEMFPSAARLPLKWGGYGDRGDVRVGIPWLLMKTSCFCLNGNFMGFHGISWWSKGGFDGDEMRFHEIERKVLKGISWVPPRGKWRFHTLVHAANMINHD